MRISSKQCMNSSKTPLKRETSGRIEARQITRSCRRIMHSSMMNSIQATMAIPESNICIIRLSRVPRKEDSFQATKLITRISNQEMFIARKVQDMRVSRSIVRPTTTIASQFINTSNGKHTTRKCSIDNQLIITTQSMIIIHNTLIRIRCRSWLAPPSTNTHTEANQCTHSATATHKLPCIPRPTTTIPP